MANSVARRVGIPGTSTVHWGEHLCAFFYTKTDLLNLVVPYIKAGLEDNEFCLWITEEGMEQQAIEALEQVLPHASQYVSRGQLEILPASKWYLTGGIFDAEKSYANWAARGRAAEAKGFVGSRTTGNPFWLQSEEDWHQFLAAICSAKDMIGTFASHHAILTYQGDRWQCLDVRRREMTA